MKWIKWEPTKGWRWTPSTFTDIRRRGYQFVLWTLYPGGKGVSIYLAKSMLKNHSDEHHPVVHVWVRGRGGGKTRSVKHVYTDHVINYPQPKYWKPVFRECWCCSSVCFSCSFSLVILIQRKLWTVLRGKWIVKFNSPTSMIFGEIKLVMLCVHRVL